MPQKKITYQQMHDDLLDMITPEDDSKLQKQLEMFQNSDAEEGLEEDPDFEAKIEKIWAKVSAYRTKMSTE